MSNVMLTMLKLISDKVAYLQKASTDQIQYSSNHLISMEADLYHSTFSYCRGEKVLTLQVKKEQMYFAEFLFYGVQTHKQYTNAKCLLPTIARRRSSDHYRGIAVCLCPGKWRVQTLSTWQKGNNPCFRVRAFLPQKA